MLHWQGFSACWIPLAGSVAFAQAPLLFPTPDFATGRVASQIRLADVDGDGRVDAVLANNATDDVTVMRNVGDGTFGVHGYFATGDGPRDLAIADLDGDFVMDVVTVQPNAQTVTYLRGVGAPAPGTFAPPVSFAAMHAAQLVRVLDHDLDGDLDLITGSNVNPNTSAQVHVNGGGATFTTKLLPTGFAINALSVGEIDANGRPDLAFVRVTHYGNLVTYLGTANGWFSLFGNKNFGGYVANDIAIADFDGDTDGDLAFGVGGHTPIVRNDGVGAGGDFTLTHYVDFGGSRIEARDFTRDGKLDLVCTGTYNSSVVLEGSGTENFAASTFAAAEGVGGVADVNGDDRDDFVCMRTLAFNDTSPAGTHLSIAIQDEHGEFGGTKPKWLPSTLYLRPRTSDVDLDGDVDLVGNPITAGGPQAPGAEVHVNDSLGNFHSGSLSPSPVSPIVGSTFGPELGDIDNDGDDDVILWTGYPNTLHCAFGDGRGAFGNWIASIVPASASGVIRNALLADLDLDGDLDVACQLPTTGASAVQIMLGNTLGGFTPSTVMNFGLIDPYEDELLGIADMNADGLPDVVVPDYTNGSGARISIAYATSSVTYATSTVSNLGGEPCDQFAPFDFDSDGRLDLVVMRPSGPSTTTTTNILSLLRNDPVVGFVVSSFASGPYAGIGQTLRVGDVDADGHGDIAVSQNYSRATLWRGNGSFGFSPLHVGVSNPDQGQFVLAATDGDAGLDIAAPRATTLRDYEAPQPCPGGFVEYGNGCFGHSYFTLHLSGHGCASPGREIAFGVSGAYGGHPVFLRFGGAAANLPLGYGCSLLVWPLAPAMVVLPTGGVGPGTGSANVAWKLPLSTPTGASVWMQAFSPDAGVVWGFASSNGLRVDVN